jgi:ComF family protein
MNQAPWWQQARLALLDLVFPPRCLGCGRTGQWFCARCIASVHYLRLPVCARCGLQVGSGLPCRSCRRHPLPAALNGLRALAQYDGELRLAIHALKYEHITALAEPLGELLTAYLMQHPLPVDAIVPVPLHPDRRAERGYNQSELLSRVLSRQSRIPLNTSALQRRLNTTPQVGLNESERRQNVKGAFQCAQRLDGMRVLVVDDVCTTGATLSECAEALHAGGAATIWGLTLAR